MPLSRDEFLELSKKLDEHSETYQIGSYIKQSAVQTDIVKEILGKSIVNNSQLTVAQVKAMINKKLNENCIQCKDALLELLLEIQGV